ncbi:MAG: hypothetical protein HZB55_01535 [Deltaproteobacteria bacterium]|nr:hypothetical protein [Deltaproteobacteria bacterium]
MQPIITSSSPPTSQSSRRRSRRRSRRGFRSSCQRSAKFLGQDQDPCASPVPLAFACLKLTADR